MCVITLLSCFLTCFFMSKANHRKKVTYNSYCQCNYINLSVFPSVINNNAPVPVHYQSCLSQDQALLVVVLLWG